jgi:hypothetical protein
MAFDSGLIGLALWRGTVLVDYNEPRFVAIEEILLVLPDRFAN